MEFLLLGAVIAGVIGMAIGSSKGKVGAGFWLGFLLGPIGWIIAALLTPSLEVQAERDRRLAAAIAGASGRSFAATASYEEAGGITADLRQDAIAEAIRREPALGSAASAEDLARLEKIVAGIEGELRLRHELAFVKARQAHEADLARQEEARRLEAERRAEQERVARQEAKQAMEEESAARAQARANRVAQASSMAPVARVFYLHRGWASLAVAVLASGLVLTIVLPLRAVSARNEHERMALAGAAASSSSASAASASSSAASSRSAAAWASMEASATSAAAEARASAEASAQASQQAAALAAAKRKTCLRGAKGNATNLSGCDLTKANLADANLAGALFDHAQLSGVTWTGAQCPDGSPASDHEGTCAQNLLHLGDELRPLAIGKSAKIGDWRVRVTSFQANSTSNGIAVDEYNREPGTGYVYAIAEIKATYLGAGQGSASDLNLAINGVTSLDDGAMCSILSGGQYETLNTGQSTSYSDCIYLLTSKTKKGTVSVTAGYSFDDAPAAYWALAK